MRHAHVTFARHVGTAPGTTTFSRRGLGQPTPDAFFPTQSVWEPDPNTDTVNIAVPPNQWVTGPVTMRVQVPADEGSMGPAPTDLQLASTRPYLPVHRGWVAGEERAIFHLQGGGVRGVEDTAMKWSIVASVVSAMALAATAGVAFARYRREHRR